MQRTIDNTSFYISVSLVKRNNPDKAEFIVFGSKAQISPHFPVNILGSLLQPADIAKNLGVCLMLTFHSQNMFRKLVKIVSSGYVTFVEIDSVLLMKWLSLLQMHWLVDVWHVVTLCLEILCGSISPNCRVFRITAAPIISGEVTLIILINN